VHTDRLTKVLLLALLAALAGNMLVYGLATAPAVAEERKPAAIGRFQPAGHDLICDTATGRIADLGGRQIVAPVSPSATDVGRYAASGWVAVVTRYATTTPIGQPIVRADLVKGYLLVDTTTGQVSKKGIYSTTTYTNQSL